MTDSGSNALIRTEGLCKHYGNFVALKELDLSIRQGEIFGYIGPNGSGKTTTIRMLAGLLKPTSGHGYVGDLEVSRDSKRIKMLVGYMPDNFGVYDEMRVWEYLDFFGAAYRIKKTQRRSRIEEVMEITGSEYMRDKFVESLSKGMKQRVGIARTLMHDPQVIILDEPANGLDPRARIEMRQLLRKLADIGKTLMVSSHILPELASVCDSVGILHEGTLVACGPVDSIMAGIRTYRLIEIKLLKEAARAAELLKANGKHHNVTIDHDNQIVQFESDAEDETLAALLSSIVQEQLSVLWYREVPVDLEDAFMAVTKMDQLGPQLNDAPRPETPLNESQATDAKA